MTSEQLSELSEKILKDFKEYTTFGLEFCDNKNLFATENNMDYNRIDCNILFKMLAVLYMSQFNLSKMGKATFDTLIL